MIISLNNNLGQYYMDIVNPADMKKAEEYFLTALHINTETKGIMQNTNKIALYFSIGQFYLKKGDLKKAINFGQKALNIEKTTSTPYYRLETYQILSKAYLENNDAIQARIYLDLFTKLNDSIKLTEKHDVNKTVNKIITTEKKNQHQEIKWVIILAITCLIIVGLSFILLWRIHSNRLRKNYESVIQNLKNNKTIHEKLAISENETSNFEIPEETLKLLLLKLEKFEVSEKYLKSNVDLPSLASQFDTNTKYLSQLIKYKREKTFSNYINGLRIEYIVKKLYEDPQFRLYKISYLAEICGFSSRDIFGSAFKKETGIMPSYFIENLNNNKDI